LGFHGFRNILRNSKKYSNWRWREVDLARDHAIDVLTYPSIKIHQIIAQKIAAKYDE
jgi:hypothetical protein